MKYLNAFEACVLSRLIPFASCPLRVLLPAVVLVLVGATALEGQDDLRRRAERRERGTYQSPTQAPQAGVMQAVPAVAPQPAIVGPSQIEVIPVPQNEGMYLDGQPYDGAPLVYPDGGAYGEFYDPSCDGLPGGLPGCGVEGIVVGEPGCGFENCGGCNACSPSGCIPLPRLCADQWFGSAEWLLWYRRGQDFPVLAARPAGAAVGAPLFGGEREGESDESGLRLTVGHWLDDAQCESIVVRIWGLDDEELNFNATGADGGTVVRPFLDVTDTAAGVAEEYIAVNPGTRDFLNIGFRSEVSGGDASLRQAWARGLGGRVDFVYGYQYLRLDENLTISSRTEGALDSTQSITDVFDVENEFHGAQVGFAVHYDERCWSFDGLAKLGFGSLRRSGNLSGTTVNRVGAATATLDEGLLVRDTNEGSTGDGTFAVSPEVNLALGYRMNRNLHATFGYTFLMITDALQTWQTLDNSLAVNFDDPALSPARPSRSFDYNDYWVQGVQFGLNYNY